MPTTPGGIYFPDGNTNADFVSIFSTVAASIDAAINNFTYDSGWVDVQPDDFVNDWETYNTTGSRVRYRKIGKITYLDGITRRGTGTDVFTLPTDFRPVEVWANFAVPVAVSTNNTYGHSARLRVTAAGVVQVYQATQANRDSGIGLSGVSFISDD